MSRAGVASAAVRTALAAGLALAAARPARGAGGAEDAPAAPPWERFATNRPRLFLEAATAGPVLAYAAQAHGDRLGRLRAHVDGLPATTNAPADLGTVSAVAAFLFLGTRTPARFAVATNLLARSVAWYRDCDRAHRVVSRYATSRVHAIVAYDWLYDALPAAAREELGRALLEHVAGRRPGPRSVPGDNQDDYRSGFYGEPSLLWYVGLATRGTGLDEAKSEAAIVAGFDQQRRLLAHRRRLAGDDGGGATVTLGYALRADPWAEFNFLHTARSACGLDLRAEADHLALLPNYVLWNRLPGGLEFGAGDAFHTSNRLPTEALHVHLDQVRHWFGPSHPDWAALAAWLQEACPAPDLAGGWPLTPLLLTNAPAAPLPRPPPADLPRARHFAGLGQVFMRSGWGDGDTVALFTAGGLTARHKHYDENTFAIFRRGFLALDTGTRPEPGSHLMQYYARTVAHNGILIRREGERMPPYWGAAAPGEVSAFAVNDGGMCRATGAVLCAFRTTPEFTYVAGDATACYDAAKCRLAVRQFVHLQPDLFVVFDRVATVGDGPPPTWLLHTATEPVAQAGGWVATHRGGRLWCHTVLPCGAVTMRVGGPGREFWSDGRNWPLPDPLWLGGERIQDPGLLGTWRLEVAPARPAARTCFLHVLATSEADQPLRPPAVRQRAEGSWESVVLQVGARTAHVAFRRDGPILCRIRLAGAGPAVDETLAPTVQPQAGWGLAERSPTTP